MCEQCSCDPQGSISTTCDSNGQCYCKNKFYGTKCNIRDCQMSPWSSWAPSCRCGYTDARSRTRSMLSRPIGNGSLCQSTKETGKCVLTPCDCAKTNPGYYGDRCQDRDCVLDQWSSWTGACDCSHSLICFEVSGCPKIKTPTKQRSRGVKITRAGSGKRCIGARSETSNCGFVCILSCEKRKMLCEYKKS